jgi:hypothetical protein
MGFGNDDLMSQHRRPTPARLRTILPGQCVTSRLIFEPEVNFSLNNGKIERAMMKARGKKQFQSVFLSGKYAERPYYFSDRHSVQSSKLPPLFRLRLAIVLKKYCKKHSVF